MKVTFLIIIKISLLFNLTYLIQPLCDASNCLSNYGECIDDICICAAGYTTTITFPNITNTNNTNKQSTNTEIDFTYCNYAYKYKDYAANFEGLMPFGAGHFYAARYGHAILKFILFWFLSLCKVLFKKRIRLNSFIENSYYICIWIFAAIYLIDYFAFSFNYYTDGNGISLLG